MTPTYTVQLPLPSTPWLALAWDGLEFLLHQWQRGFAEARHDMLFPQAQGFSGDREYHSGDVFQRALIADVLCDLNGLLPGQLTPMLSHEVAYLLSCQRATGGWSYFPTLPELPPDADDLAQVLQVLWRTQGPSMAAACEAPLAMLLEHNIHRDGSFETWILPRPPRTPEQELQTAWVQAAWGSGPDHGVMANLLYALALYDRDRFAPVIEAGVAYLQAQQQPEGHWLGSWYEGPYYVTYVCLRLLTLAAPTAGAIDPALDFLQRQQYPDGGWGISASDPLNTALALLGLACAKATPPPPASIAAALAYLQTCQAEDLAWEMQPFIRMELGRAQGQVRQVLFYGSRTITTALVVKAACSWHGCS